MPTEELLELQLVFRALSDEDTEEEASDPLTDDDSVEGEDADAPDADDDDADEESWKNRRKPLRDCVGAFFVP